jgi:predicted carbohydrate-binding protein with CBM5 and CBM33 domain
MDKFNLYQGYYEGFDYAVWSNQEGTDFFYSVEGVRISENEPPARSQKEAQSRAKEIIDQENEENELHDYS